MATQTYKQVECDPTCGFLVRTHNDRELKQIVKDHAKRIHNMKLSDKEVDGMAVNV